MLFFFDKNFLVKTKKESGKNLRKSGKSQGKIREFDGIKKWDPAELVHKYRT